MYLRSLYFYTHTQTHTQMYNIAHIYVYLYIYIYTEILHISIHSYNMFNISVMVWRVAFAPKIMPLKAGHEAIGRSGQASGRWSRTVQLPVLETVERAGLATWSKRKNMIYEIYETWSKCNQQTTESKVQERQREEGCPAMIANQHSRALQ